MSIRPEDRQRIVERAAVHRFGDAEFAAWADGCGVIRHDDLTQSRVHYMALLLEQKGVVTRDEIWRLLAAADRLTNAAMWLVVHLTYARTVRTDGTPLDAADFKPNPEGHTGGALNMVPAYVGYLLANALSGTTRAWIMGQGHCVAAIDAVNVLTGNMGPRHAERYDRSDAGLSRMAQDFYRCEVEADGTPVSPLGSHVNSFTAGGIAEGGYLGFTELQYIHMPLPGERLVAFLSDGAFEEQRGSDWTSRWWRSKDSGLAVPVMIANGRRIDQRTTLSQSGGVAWLHKHLQLCGFDPTDIDGRDPAAFAWAILDAEERLLAWSEAERRGEVHYPAPFPYIIADTEKGYGFPGAGTNRAHNLPLIGNPFDNEQARKEFNDGCERLFIGMGELDASVETLNNHESRERPRERDHALARFHVETPILPEPPWRSEEEFGEVSPMAGIDAFFPAIVRANPQLRPRVGNPDEMRSNRLGGTLDFLKHRVTDPEQGVAEAIDGAVVTALNEETVVSAAIGNKRGINLVASYEAFAVKMLGALRQELIFARHQRESGAEPGWLSFPIILTSHAWENGKNEQSHQDPTLCEALMGEMSDASRVLFPADWNSACAALEAVYHSHGTLFPLVVPKRPMTDRFTPTAARDLIAKGAVRVEGAAACRVQFVAVGAYQLTEAMRAAHRCRERGVTTSVIYIVEPGRFRIARDGRESAMLLSDAERNDLFGETEARVFLTHSRPEPVLGMLRPLDLGPTRTRALGYINRGGTLDVFGMLFANRCTWAHAVAVAAELLDIAPPELLNDEELGALEGRSDPHRLVAPVMAHP